MPYDLFGINVTPEALAYLQVPGLQTGTIDQTVYSGSVTGDLGSIGFKSPFASDSIQVVFGAEQREDTLKNVTDDSLASFQLSGTGGPTIGLEGSTKVLDLFTEMRIPAGGGRALRGSARARCRVSLLRLRPPHHGYL